MKKIILILVFIGLVVGGMMYYYTQRDSRNDIVTKVSMEELSATDLYLAFDENEGEAEARYLGKVITVKGQVQQVETETGKVSISLNTGDPLSAIVCEMNEKIQSDFSEVKEGQEISIKGECTGKLIDIILNNCVINK